MIGRIRVLTRYLFGRVSRSLTGQMFGLSALVLWLIFFNPSGGRVPEPALLILLVGAYGAALAILVTLDWPQWGLVRHAGLLNIRSCQTCYRLSIGQNLWPSRCNLRPFLVNVF